MKILAIDTSSKICSVSILEDNKVIIEKNSDDEKTHSQKLMPLVKNIFDESKFSLDDINLIACCIGPGSFTGIRIGVSTAKAFADAKNIPVVGVTSLESLAYNVTTPGYIVSLIDAKNSNVYYSLYELSKTNTYSLIGNFVADNINNIISLLKNNNIDNSRLIFIGDGAMIHKELIQNNFPESSFASESKNNQSSISIGKSGFDKFNLNLSGNSDSLAPIYLKKSQAERALNGEL